MAKKNKKKQNKFKIFIIFLLFIGIGIAIGVFATKKYLEDRDLNKTPVVDDGPLEITDDAKYQELIINLRNMLNADPMFYSTKGVVASSLDNTSRLTLLYNYILNNNLAKSEELAVDYFGASKCGEFLMDNSFDTTSSNKCTVISFSTSLIKELNEKIFNDDILDTSVSFSIGVDKKCLLETTETTDYICGNITNLYGYSGELESKFDVIKVTKDSSGTIIVYEKGYLVDNRSNVNDPFDQYDNYYLHSSDSNEYYYELKSADNLIFKHTFKTDDKENYYYIGTELVKE